jgi:hypothetical protein
MKEELQKAIVLIKNHCLVHNQSGAECDNCEIKSALHCIHNTTGMMIANTPDLWDDIDNAIERNR